MKTLIGNCLLAGFLIYGQGCQTKAPRVVDLKDLVVCIYTHEDKVFECSDSLHDMDVPADKADGYIAYPPLDHSRLMRECLK